MPSDTETWQFRNFFCMVFVMIYKWNKNAPSNTWYECQTLYFSASRINYLGPFSLAWMDLNPNMDKYSHAQWSVGWDYLSIRKLQWCNHLKIDNFDPHFMMDEISYPCWIRVGKRGPEDSFYQHNLTKIKLRLSDHIHSFPWYRTYSLSKQNVIRYKWKLAQFYIICYHNWNAEYVKYRCEKFTRSALSTQLCFRESMMTETCIS